MIPKPTLPLLTSAVVAVSLLGSVLYFVIGRKKRYSKVARVKKLFFYPVKSLKGIEVKELHCKPLGVEYNGLLERTFMIVTDNGVLVSQREEPSLVLLTPSFVGDTLQISGSKDSEDLVIPLKHTRTPEDKIIECNVHRDLIKGIDCGEEAALWFQKYLKRKDVRLVRHVAGIDIRSYGGNDPNNAKMKKDYPVAFQDLAPLHLISESSISDLNSRIENEEVSVLNFRPNVLVEGSAPLAEDEWMYVKFSSGAEMVCMLPCGRCVLTTVNPATGIKTDKQPLVALRKYRIPKDKVLYRRVGYSPCFGMQFALKKEGYIHVGDDVHAVVQNGMYEYVGKEV